MPPSLRPQTAQPSSHNIAVLLGYEGWAAGVQLGIARYARLHTAWNLLPLGAYSPKEISNFTAWRIDGIIGAPLNSQDLALYRRHVPTVITVEFPEAHRLPTVCSDNIAIGRLAAEYLLGLGLRSFGYLTSYSPDEGLRRTGFEQVLQAAGYECRVRYCNNWWDLRHHARLERELGCWAADLPRPAGVLASLDQLGTLLIWGARTVGLAVPDELAVLGMNDEIVHCEYANPSLSSINLDSEKIGYQAAALLDRLLAGHPPPAQPQRIPPRGITERASTNVLAFDDEDVTQAVRFIRDHALDSEKITAADVVAAVSVSRGTLQPRFKQWVGRTISQEIWRLRLQRAEQLLTRTHDTLYQIALETGFQSRGHLSRKIKAHTGKTPRQLRHS